VSTANGQKREVEMKTRGEEAGGDSGEKVCIEGAVCFRVELKGRGRGGARGGGRNY